LYAKLIGAANYLQKLCVNKVPPVGKIHEFVGAHEPANFVDEFGPDGVN
jgi:hypothetical protein